MEWDVIEARVVDLADRLPGQENGAGLPLRLEAGQGNRQRS